MKSDLLKEILEHKRNEVAEVKQRYALETLEDLIKEQGQARGFLRTLQQAVASKRPAVVAEIKRASPSKGILRKDFDPLALARSYMMSGASCLSVLTDGKYFQGSGAILDLVRRHCPLPTLRKDFIIDAYQVYESRALGADCILLIAAALPIAQLEELHQLATTQGMDVLVEVHDETELTAVLGLGDVVTMIGINNRNLATFEVDIQTSIRLVQEIPADKLVISESGIGTHQDIEQLFDAGIYACLVGESLMTAADPGAQLQALLGNHKPW